jgi:CheY-like chemotaxis protein
MPVFIAGRGEHCEHGTGAERLIESRSARRTLETVPDLTVRDLHAQCAGRGERAANARSTIGDVAWACLRPGFVFKIEHKIPSMRQEVAARDQVMDKLSGNILLVEDDEDLRETTTKALESAGLTVLAVPDHREALDVLDGKSPVDLLVTDVIFPGRMRGFALAYMARMRRLGIKVLYVIGFDGPEAEVEADGKVLHKPISNEQLISEVRLALAG